MQLGLISKFLFKSRCFRILVYWSVFVFVFVFVVLSDRTYCRKPCCGAEISLGNPRSRYGQFRFWRKSSFLPILFNFWPHFKSGNVTNPTAKKCSWFSVLQLFAAQFATLLLRISTMLDIMQTGPGAKII